MAEPEKLAGAYDDRPLASDADREPVIETLKDAFVRGRLTRDEFNARVSHALAPRTHLELAALTADIPVGAAAAKPIRRKVAVRRRPLVKATAASTACLAFAFGLVLFAANVLDPAGLGNPYHPWSGLCAFFAFAALLAAPVIMAWGVNAAKQQRRARGNPVLPSPACPGESAEGVSSGDYEEDLLGGINSLPPT